MTRIILSLSLLSIFAFVSCGNGAAEATARAHRHAASFAEKMCELEQLKAAKRGADEIGTCQMEMDTSYTFLQMAYKEIIEKGGDIKKVRGECDLKMAEIAKNCHK